MSFGLRNAPATSQRLISLVVGVLKVVRFIWMVSFLVTPGIIMCSAFLRCLATWPRRCQFGEV